MLKRTNNWLHLPTGARGESEFEQVSLSDSQAIRMVNQWNSKHRNVWFYWI
jgi:hypothetical protein